MRLIDADALKEYATGGVTSVALLTLAEIDEAPTVNAIVIPCNIGDTVFRMLPYEDFVMKCTVCEYVFTDQTYMVVREEQFNSRRGFPVKEIGETVFFTRKEAERALSERKVRKGLRR